jgi:transposase
MRLGILPTGYIYPKSERGLRDLMRRRMKLVQERSQHLISLKTQYQRQTGHTLQTNKIKTKSFQLPVVGDENVPLSMQSNLYLSRILAQTILKLEASIKGQVKHTSRCDLLKTVDGIGDILAETIMFETGSIQRFKSEGNFASYCRCVDSRRTSNGKKKGAGNRKNGNKYLAWAFIEAASKAIVHSAEAKKFYEKKKRAGNTCVAMKALAHKLARACYHIMKKKEVYNPDKLFA